MILFKPLPVSGATDTDNGEDGPAFGKAGSQVAGGNAPDTSSEWQRQAPPKEPVSTWPLLSLWRGGELPLGMSFKLLRTSLEGAQRLAGGALECHPNPGTMDVNAVLQAEGRIGNSPVCFLLDSEAVVSVICCNMVPALAMRRMEPVSSSTVAANGLPLDVAGQVSVLASLSRYCVTHTFLL